MDTREEHLLTIHIIVSLLKPIHIYYNVISRRATPEIVLSSKSEDERARLDEKIYGMTSLAFLMGTISLVSYIHVIVKLKILLYH